MSSASASFASAKAGLPRNVSPSYNPSQSITGMRSSSTVVSGDPMENTGSAIVPSSGMTITRQSARATARKPAPPIPQKPPLLASRSSHGSNFVSGGYGLPQRDRHAESSNIPVSSQRTSTGTATNVNLPPPPRRAPDESFKLPSSSQTPPPPQPITIKQPSDDHIDDGPALAPRRQGSVGQTNGLMDENDDAMREMVSWQPLRPQ